MHLVKKCSFIISSFYVTILTFKKKTFKLFLTNIHVVSKLILLILAFRQIECYKIAHQIQKIHSRFG